MMELNNRSDNYNDDILWVFFSYIFYIFFHNVILYHLNNNTTEVIIYPNSIGVETYQSHDGVMYYLLTINTTIYIRELATNMKFNNTLKSKATFTCTPNKIIISNNILNNNMKTGTINLNNVIAK